MKRSRYDRITREHKPEAILRGRETCQRADQPAQMTDDTSSGDRARAKRRKPDAGSLSFPHYLMWREAGSNGSRAAGGRSSQFAAVKYQQNACMAAIAEYDTSRLAGATAKNIGKLLERLEKEQPETFRLLQEHLVELNFDDGHRHPASEPVSVRVPLPFLHSYDVSTLISPIKTSNSRIRAFSRICLIEITSRFLQQLVKVPPARQTGDDMCEIFRERVDAVALPVARESMLGALLAEAADPDFNNRQTFEKILISALIILYETGDVARTRTELRQAVEARWPRLPRREAPGEAEDPVDVRKARGFVQFSRSSLPAEICRSEPVSGRETQTQGGIVRRRGLLLFHLL